MAAPPSTAISQTSVAGSDSGGAGGVGLQPRGLGRVETKAIQRPSGEKTGDRPSGWSAFRGAARPESPLAIQRADRSCRDSGSIHCRAGDPPPFGREAGRLVGLDPVEVGDRKRRSVLRPGPGAGQQDDREHEGAPGTHRNSRDTHRALPHVVAGSGAACLALSLALPCPASHRGFCRQDRRRRSHQGGRRGARREDGHRSESARQLSVRP